MFGIETNQETVEFILSKKKQVIFLICSSIDIYFFACSRWNLSDSHQILSRYTSDSC